eukprot:352093-Chlamydomonas_euryale.AAC.2
MEDAFASPGVEDRRMLRARQGGKPRSGGQAHACARGRGESPGVEDRRMPACAAGGKAPEWRTGACAGEGEGGGEAPEWKDRRGRGGVEGQARSGRTGACAGEGGGGGEAPEAWPRHEQRPTAPGTCRTSDAPRAPGKLDAAALPDGVEPVALRGAGASACTQLSGKGKARAALGRLHAWNQYPHFAQA